MEHHIMNGIVLDGNGLAVVIAACCTGVATLTGLVMNVINFFDARKIKKQNAELKTETAEIKTLSVNRDVQIQQVKDLVNGKTEKETQAAAQAGYEQGREHERLAPGTPSPRVAVVPSAAIATAIAPVEGNRP